MSETLIVICPHCDAPNRLPASRMAEGSNCGKCKKPLFQGHPVPLNGGNFDIHVGRSDLPLVVDFWAPWCGPCRAMAPAFEAAARKLEPNFRLAKVNTEIDPQLAARFAIRSIPTLAIFQGGREIARQSGALDEGSLVRWVRATA